MKDDTQKDKPWWTDYDGKRLLGLFAVLVVASAIPAGILHAYVMIRFTYPDSIVSAVTWALSMALPVMVVLGMRKTGRDRWLLRKQLRERDARNI